MKDEIQLSNIKSSRARRVIRTFDIFDTLIARRCIDANQIFMDVEARSGVAGFAQARQVAERNVYHREYNLSDIYASLRDLLAIGDGEAESLMHLEVLLELENVIPIASTINSLTQESVLITDMYLPTPVIRELLNRAGILRDYPILVGSHGKSSGSIWKYFAEHGFQCIHHGDNERSDVLNAQEHGMRARLERSSLLTDFESFLRESGARQAAGALRATRLQVDLDGMPEWLQRLQFNLNLPFLLVSVLNLMNEVRERHIENIFFASRDGRHLESAFMALRGNFTELAGVEAEYWYTSRVARTSGSNAYLKYCEQTLPGSVALVDLCGTGASITRLLSDLGMQQRQSVLIYLAQKVSDQGYSDRMAKCYGLGSSEDLMPIRHAFDTASYVNNSIIEQLNYVPEGMIRDVMMTPSGALPVRDDVDFDGDALHLVEQQNNLLTAFFAQLPKELTTEALDELIRFLPKIYEWMLLNVTSMSQELKMLKDTIGVDDVSNENFTQKDLFR